MHKLQQEPSVVPHRPFWGASATSIFHARLVSAAVPTQPLIPHPQPPGSSQQISPDGACDSSVISLHCQESTHLFKNILKK